MKTTQQRVYNLLSLLSPTVPSTNNATAQQIDDWYQEEIKTLTNKIKELEDEIHVAKYGISISHAEHNYNQEGVQFDINHYNKLKEDNDQESLLYLLDMGHKSKHNAYLFHKFTKDLDIPNMNNDELVHLSSSLSGSPLKNHSDFIKVLNLIRYTLFDKNGQEKAKQLFVYQPDFDIDVELKKLGLNGTN